MTIGLFGGIFIARAVTVTPVKAGFFVWAVLNPIPKAVSNDTRQLYVLIVPQVSYGTAPYLVTVTIGVNGGVLMTSTRSILSNLQGRRLQFYGQRAQSIPPRLCT
jgi:hypothetical protein